MIEDRYLKKLKKIQKEYAGDEEVRHIEEDYILCELLEELGYTRLIEQYNSTGKWYA